MIIKETKKICAMGTCIVTVGKLLEQPYLRPVYTNIMRLYRLYKDRLTVEQYLKCNLSRYERSVFAKLRSGSLPLEIETGRYKGLDLEERVCQKCHLATEDEVHFMVDCSFYNDLRYKLMTALASEFEQFKDAQSLTQFIMIMNSKHVRLIVQTVASMFARRKLYD